MTREAAIKILMDGELNPCVAEDREACDMAIKALEQEPKSEWEHDHEILKAYSDGANEVLDKIRAEILKISSYEGFELGRVKDGYHIAMVNVLNIIDKYKAESEG